MVECHYECPTRVWILPIRWQLPLARRGPCGGVPGIEPRHRTALPRDLRFPRRLQVLRHARLRRMRLVLGTAKMYGEEWEEEEAGLHVRLRQSKTGEFGLTHEPRYIFII